MTSGQHFPRDAQSFLVEIVEDAIKSRKANNVETNDFIHALIEMEQQAKNGKVKI